MNMAEIAEIETYQREDILEGKQKYWLAKKLICLKDLRKYVL